MIKKFGCQFLKKNTGQGQLRFLYTGQGHIRLVLYKVKWEFYNIGQMRLS